MDLGVSGLASGFDWRSLVDQLADVERAPQRRLRAEQGALEQRGTAYAGIQTQLDSVQSRLETLLKKDFFDSRLAGISDSSVLGAIVASGASLASYSFNFIQLATASRQQGAPQIAAPLSETSNVSGVVLSSAGFSTPVTAGIFSVNGQAVSIETSDTLQEVFDKIAAATGGAVTASYDPGADRITLSSAGEIVLGTATDTSNFLHAARLNNNGSGEITSSSGLAGIKTGVNLAGANFATALSDGGEGNGEFKINGVSISFDASADTLANVIDRINNSGAGVLAGYDPVGDRMILSNKSTGDVGIAFEDVTGNFLAATGISGGSLQRGKNLVYTIDGGEERVSHTNTVTASGLGITGLTVTALQEGSASVNVASDTAQIKQAIVDFIEDYNKAQSLIQSRTVSSTDATGTVTGGVLSGDMEANRIGSQLRALAYAWTPGTLRSLADLGIVTSGQDNSLTLADESKLEAALESRLSAVSALFSDPDHGIAVRLNAYLERTIGDDGTLPQRQGNISKQAAAIETQIANMERQIQANRQRMIASFLAMEQAQARINQQLQFLQQRFNQINQPA
jgi:flagellar hook-associated protein 2